MSMSKRKISDGGDDCEEKGDMNEKKLTPIWDELSAIGEDAPSGTWDAVPANLSTTPPWSAIGEWAEIERLREENESLKALAMFGRWVLDMRGEYNCADLGGDDIQNKAVEFELLCGVTAKESCGEDCNCAEYVKPGEWPVLCFRMTDKAKVLSVDH